MAWRLNGVFADWLVGIAVLACPGCGTNESSSNLCTAPATRCNGPYVETCVQGTWVAGTNCAELGKICSDGDCTIGSGWIPEPDCTCDADATCQLGCACDADCVAGACTTGATLCFSASTLQICIDSHWDTLKCASYCEAQNTPFDFGACLDTDGPAACLCGHCGDGQCTTGFESPATCEQDCPGCDTDQTWTCSGPASISYCDGVEIQTVDCLTECKVWDSRTTHAYCTQNQGSDVCECEWCGNGTCSSEAGESASTCPQDC